MVCFKRILRCSFKPYASRSQRVCASSKYHDLGVFVHTQKIKRGKACGVSVTSGSVLKPPIATDWQTVLSPKIGQRKMKTDGQDRALAGALTCSLQVSRDLLYSHPPPPSLSLLFAPFFVILFHVAHGTNKDRGSPSVLIGLSHTPTLIWIFLYHVVLEPDKVTPSLQNSSGSLG